MPTIEATNVEQENLERRDAESLRDHDTAVREVIFADQNLLSNFREGLEREAQEARSERDKGAADSLNDGGNEAPPDGRAGGGSGDRPDEGRGLDSLESPKTDTREAIKEAFGAEKKDS